MSADAIHREVTTRGEATARVGTGLRVKGEISGNGDLYVDGDVEGPIQLADGKLTVGTSGTITADVVAREVIIYGRVKGNLQARDRIEIKKEGSVVGDLLTARIVIEDGAQFKGSIEIDRKALAAAAPAGEPGLARAATADPTPI